MASGLRQHVGRFTRVTRGVGFVDITADVCDWLAACRVGDGLIHVFVQHTSASLTIQENADPRVLQDLVDALQGLAPELATYRHNSEGPDDMPAHIKSMLTSTDLSLPVRSGDLALGTWQGLYLIEHRTRPHERSILLTYQGT